MNLLHVLRGRRIEIHLSHVELVKLRNLGEAAGNIRNVQGQLPDRHRLSMRLPSQLVRWNPAQNPLRNRSFLAELVQHRFNHSYHVRVSSFRPTQPCLSMVGWSYALSFSAQHPASVFAGAIYPLVGSTITPSSYLS